MTAGSRQEDVYGGKFSGMSVREGAKTSKGQNDYLTNNEVDTLMSKTDSIVFKSAGRGLKK